jgi:hypothetical protein
MKDGIILVTIEQKQFLTTRAGQPVQFLAGTSDISSPQSPGQLWSSPSFILDESFGSYPGVKQPRYKTDHPPPFSAEVKNVYRSSKHKDNFTFTFTLMTSVRYVRKYEFLRTLIIFISLYYAFR